MSRTRLFLDANVLVSACWKPDSRVQLLWQIPGVELVTSSLVVAECNRNIHTPERRERLSSLLGSVRVAQFSREPRLDTPLPLVPKDQHVLAAAVLLRCQFLVTGDRMHFGAWYGGTLHGIRIEPPASFPSVLQRT